MTYFLGKKPAREGAVKLKLSNYIDADALPAPPVEFGHEHLIQNWGVLMNDRLGCCAISGSSHEHMLWEAEAGEQPTFNDQSVVENYSAITGYDPSQVQSDGTNPTDQGTDVAELAAYRQQVGIVDANGNRHKVGAYVALTPGDIDELWTALYYFDGVGIGVQFPEQWMQQMQTPQPIWDALDYPEMAGGHYISGVAKRGGNIMVVTWGQLVPMTPAGYEQFCDEAVAYISTDKLRNGVTLEGLNWDQLQADLQTLNTGEQLQ